LLIVLVAEPSTARGFARGLQHLADHDSFELFGHLGDFVGLPGRFGIQHLMKGLAIGGRRGFQGLQGRGGFQGLQCRGSFQRLQLRGGLE